MDIQALQNEPPLTAAEFTCSVHGSRAGEVRLHGAGDDWIVVVDSFLSMTRRVDTAQAAAVLAALSLRNASALHRLDLEYVPFYCPDCRAVYCQDCWRTVNVFDDEMPGWLEETRGTCPAGHERMLMD